MTDEPAKTITFIEALAKAQGEMRNVIFDRQNPHFRNKYASLPAFLDVIRKPLADNNLVLTQTKKVIDGQLMLVSVLRHASGDEPIIDYHPLPPCVAGQEQKFGSALTYARRYSLQGFFPISGDEDDDANAAQSAAVNGSGAGEKLTDEQANEIASLLMDTKSDIPLFLNWAKAASVGDIKRTQYPACIAMRGKKEANVTSRQQTEEWFQQRLGKVTASRVADVTARTKSGWGASRKNYMAEIILERLTGQRAEQYTNASMQWGIDKEPEARAAYASYVDTAVEEVGFCPHPTIAMAGASPDGLVGDGLVEIKCPDSATHLEYLLGTSVDDRYFAQMHFQMACTGRQWCDFVSYDSRMPGHMQLWVHRVYRNSAIIKGLEDAVVVFLAELDDKLAALNRLYSGQPSDLHEKLKASAAS